MHNDGLINDVIKTIIKKTSYITVFKFIISILPRAPLTRHSFYMYNLGVLYHVLVYKSCSVYVSITINMAICILQRCCDLQLYATQFSHCPLKIMFSCHHVNLLINKRNYKGEMDKKVLNKISLSIKRTQLCNF